MARNLTRILSDVHYGDRASRVDRIEQLAPLLDDVDKVVFNGDTLDTRKGPNPAHTAACRSDVLKLASLHGNVTFLTGNHDPDFSESHFLDLAAGEVFVVHGDVLFDNIVPWGRDAREIHGKIRQAVGSTDTGMWQMPITERLAIWRAVAKSIPQRHQSERQPLKYAARFLADTVWPPTRFLEIFRAWYREPRLASRLAAAQRPNARYMILGHTHRPTIRQRDGGPVVINTGSFTAPFGGFVVDLSEEMLRVRRVARVAGEFRPGAVVAEFPLAKR